MNRRGFIGTLAALVGAVVAKVKPKPTDHLIATYSGTFAPTFVPTFEDERLTLFSYYPREFIEAGRALPTGELIVLKRDKIYSAATRLPIDTE
jgi:hypothetical protein